MHGSQKWVPFALVEVERKQRHRDRANQMQMHKIGAIRVCQSVDASLNM